VLRPLGATKGDEDALVARVFSRPCRHSCRHVFSRVFKGVPMAVRATKGDEDALDGSM
jgi:hypothetical protein